MRAMVLERASDAARNPLVAAELADPRPADGEVVIQVDACAVCRTDVHIVEGEVAANLPVVPGHQVIGTIVEVAADVENIRVGDRVGVGWLSSTDGNCRFCVTGRENLCRNARFTGRDRDGGYAERMAAPASAVYPIPDGFRTREAAPLLCAGVIGYRTFRLSGADRGARLGLFGFGASAHLVLQVARAVGCEVYVFTREERHRELAREMGARWAGGVGDDPGVLLDAAASFAPAGDVVPAALARLDRGATLAINAIHMTPIPAFEYELLYGERALRSVMNFTRRDVREFLELAARIPLRVETEAFALEEANDVLRRVRAGGIRGAAVLMVR